MGGSIFVFTPLQRRAFETLAAAIFVFDLFAQAYYLRGPLYTAPAGTWALACAGAMLGAVCLARRRMARVALGLLALLHYFVTYRNGQLFTEGDTWIWLLVLAYLPIPPGEGAVESSWVAVFTLVGFCVYFFAGLHKVIRPEWLSGEALRNIFLDHALVNPHYLFLTRSPLLAKLGCWVTLAQRLIVPWGFWSSRPAIRRSSAAILAVMHYAYMMIMNLGTFSWVGLLYLLPILLGSARGADYFRRARGEPAWSRAAAYGAMGLLVFFPSVQFGEALGYHPPPALAGKGAAGILLNWGMFAVTAQNQTLPIYSVKTCTGKILTDDEVYWAFGESRDYFRRRALKGIMAAELLDQSRRGPLESRILQNFPELVHERRTVIYRISGAAPERLYDGGPEKVADCPQILSPPGPR